MQHRIIMKHSVPNIILTIPQVKDNKTVLQTASLVDSSAEQSVTVYPNTKLAQESCTGIG
jgi:hypothetical protein